MNGNGIKQIMLKDLLGTNKSTMGIVMNKGLAHLDRNTRKGFTKYMKANPIYFRDIWGEISIQKAFDRTRKLKEEYELFKEGI
jgi:hypothetical protein